MGCRTLVARGVDPALGDRLAAGAQARADFAVRQGGAAVAHPVAATAVAVAVAMAAVAMPVAGRGPRWRRWGWFDIAKAQRRRAVARSEEHTSELQSLMRISYAVFCLKKKKKKQKYQ